jgi:flagellar biosynthesis protein FlhA
LARTISARYRDKHHRLYVVTLDPALEAAIGEAAEPGTRGFDVRLSPRSIDALCGRIAAETEGPSSGPAVLLVSPRIRPAVKQITSGPLPRLAVLSYDEIARDTQIESLALIGVEVLDEETAPARARLRPAAA